MERWKEISISGIAKIEKCVAEFNIWELNISPYAKFKVKVYESNSGKFSGYSNLLIADEKENFNCAVGYGGSIDEALQDTLNNFFQLSAYKPALEWKQEDFRYSDSFNF